MSGLSRDEIALTFRTEHGLAQNYAAADFLVDPAPDVVRAAIDEIRRLRALLILTHAGKELPE